MHQKINMLNSVKTVSTEDIFSPFIILFIWNRFEAPDTAREAWWQVSTWLKVMTKQTMKNWVSTTDRHAYKVTTNVTIKYVKRSELYFPEIFPWLQKKLNHSRLLHWFANWPKERLPDTCCNKREERNMTNCLFSDYEQTGAPRDR